MGSAHAPDRVKLSDTGTMLMAEGHHFCPRLLVLTTAEQNNFVFLGQKPTGP